MISYELNANGSVSVFNNGILVAIYNAPIIRFIGRIPVELVDIVINNAVSISETGFVPEIAKLSTSR